MFEVVFGGILGAYLPSVCPSSDIAAVARTLKFKLFFVGTAFHFFAHKTLIFKNKLKCFKSDLKF